MKNFEVGQKVEAIVERVLPFGVFARLKDGTLAYIRQRELNLDADTDASSGIHPGDVITAMVIKSEKSEKHLELSRRATLGNPWVSFAEQHAVGDVVRGTVRAVQPSNLYVRVAAGVEGSISRQEMASWLVNRPDELFWIGDEVEVIIVGLDPRNKRLSLSIRSRMMRYSQAWEMYRHIACPEAEEGKEVLTEFVERPHKPIPTLPVGSLGKILVVEDDEGVCASLSDWLSQRGLSVDQAVSLPEAISQLRQHSYEIIFLDMNLAADDGLEVVRFLQAFDQPPHVCVMSSPYTILERMHELTYLHIARCFPKPLDMDEIDEYLSQAAKGDFTGKPYLASQIGPASSEVSGIPRGIIDSMQAHGTRTQETLDWIRQIVGAQMSLLFEKDLNSHSISILARSGHLHVNNSASYMLKDSPVNDVIRRGTSVYENRIEAKGAARFDKLLKLVSFNSCIGMPIQLQDEIHHAFFLFHTEAEAFHRQHLQSAMAGALLLAAILKNESLDQRLQILNPVLLSGELMAGLGHEVFNKISSLEIQVRNLLPLRGDSVETEASLGHLLNVIMDLKGLSQNFQQIMISSNHVSHFDAHAVLQRAAALLRPIARQESAQVILRAGDGLPMLQGNSIALQQVFVNLMLNAFQQMTEKSRKYNWNGPRVLEVSNSLAPAGDKVLMRFTDTGPGIHRQLWEKIFSPGFSTRGGSGLGLYIARSFLKPIGGTIRVEESLIPLGTTFLVELPVLKPEGGIAT
jgi:signal transduction histidine kinase/CheY-like chemotaxis protein/predicted RNA-binding protein with RPS1 domain